VTAWLPYDANYCSELYKIIVTQLKFVRTVIDATNSFSIKRSKQAANALDISSRCAEDIDGVKEVLAELVNFRIKADAYKYKYEPKSRYVKVIESKYEGKDILGSQVQEDGAAGSKNFVVSVALKFGIKIFVAYDSEDPKQLRISFVGKPEGITAAVEVVEELIANVNNGTNEASVQAAILEKINAPLAVSPVIGPLEPLPVAARVVLPSATLPMPTPTPSPMVLQSPGAPLFRVLQRLPTMVNVENNSFAAHNFEKPPGATFHMSPDQMFNAVFIQTFSSTFATAFASAFHAAHANALCEANKVVMRQTMF
jgi:hypothetical protein